MLVIAALIAAVFALRRRAPLVALGIALFLGCHVLTATILPLELILRASQRTSRASVCCWRCSTAGRAAQQRRRDAQPLSVRINTLGALPLSLPRHVLLGGLLLLWTGLTALTAYAWGNPLKPGPGTGQPRAAFTPRAI